MRKSIFPVILTSIGLLCLPCKGDVPDPAPPSCLYSPADTPKVDVVWNVPNAPAYSEVHSMSPIITDHGVLFSTCFYENTSEVIHLYDKNTGQLKWSWSDWFVPTDVSLTKFVKDNKLVVIDWRYVYVIDMNTGATVWKDAQTSYMGASGGWLAGDYIYHPILDKNPGNTIAHLLRTKIDSPKWDTVLTLKKTNGFSPSIESVNLWKAQNGDSLLVFQNRAFNFNTLKSKIDLCAFNLRSRQMVWTLENIDPDGHADVNASLYIHNNRCYYAGSTALAAYDISTGNKTWEYKGASGNLLFVNDNIYAKTNQGLLLCLNETTGSVVWRNEKSGTSGANLVYDNDRIYCLSHEGLFCYASTDGHTVFQYKSPNESRTGNKAKFAGTGNSGCAIDPTTRRMYLADSYYVMCITVPQ